MKEAHSGGHPKTTHKYISLGISRREHYQGPKSPLDPLAAERKASSSFSSQKRLQVGDISSEWSQSHCSHPHNTTYCQTPEFDRLTRYSSGICCGHRQDHTQSVVQSSLKVDPKV